MEGERCFPKNLLEPCWHQVGLQSSTAKQAPGQEVPHSLIFQVPLLSNPHLPWGGEIPLLLRKTGTDSIGSQELWTLVVSSPVCFAVTAWGRVVAGGEQARWAFSQDFLVHC